MWLRVVPILISDHALLRRAFCRFSIALAIAAVCGTDIAYAERSGPDLLERGIRCEAENHFACAKSLYDQALRADPKLSEGIVGLGRLDFVAGRFDAAIAHFRRARILNSKAPYPMIWLYLAELRAGKSADTELRTGVEAGPTQEWPGPVISFLLGSSRRDELVEAALDAAPSIRDKARCESNAYVGEYDLGLDDNKELAISEFTAAVNTCGKTWPEGALASVEARRLRAMGFRPSFD